MAENSSIEWCDHTFNPWIGCTHVSPGCIHCYAETLMDQRYGKVEWGKGKARMRTSVANWRKPLAWDKQAAAEGIRYRVFCSSLADVFDEEVDYEWRVDLCKLIDQTPHLDWLLLTKRPHRVKRELEIALDRFCEPWLEAHPNVWIGTSVEDQRRADERIPHLLNIPARVRFLSCEPLLGSVDLTRWLPPVPGSSWAYEVMTAWGEDTHTIDWVIAGGESGRGARPMHPDWARSLRDQCQAAGVPFLFKQHGEYTPYRKEGVPTIRVCEKCGQSRCNCTPYEAWQETVYRVGKKAAGRVLDGQTWDEFPEVTQ